MIFRISEYDSCYNAVGNGYNPGAMSSASTRSDVTSVTEVVFRKTTASAALGTRQVGTLMQRSLHLTTYQGNE